VDSAPKYGDSDNTLLFKIVQKLSDNNGGAFAPRYGDSTNRLLQKWAKLLFTYGI